MRPVATRAREQRQGRLHEGRRGAGQCAAETQPLGPIASVVDPDGTVYIGNLNGELRAFRTDGTPYWTRGINSMHGRST